MPMGGKVQKWQVFSFVTSFSALIKLTLRRTAYTEYIEVFRVLFIGHLFQILNYLVCRVAYLF